MILILTILMAIGAFALIVGSLALSEHWSAMREASTEDYPTLLADLLSE